MQYQKQYRGLRDTMRNNIVNILHLEIKDRPQSAVQLREPFKTELFRLALKEVSLIMEYHPYGSMSTSYMFRS